MQNPTIIKTTPTQKSQKQDIEQSQCPSSQSQAVPEQISRTTSQIIIPDPIHFTGSRASSADVLPAFKPVVPAVEKKPTKGFRGFRRIKKNKKKNQSDYRKNICGYITKKVIREFTSNSYYQRVKSMCRVYQCDYMEAKNFYSSKVERVTGPSHIPDLLIPRSQGQRNFKRMFTNFFNWFLNQRYIRYLLVEGKMSDKRAYIEYKNNILLPLIQQKISQAPNDYPYVDYTETFQIQAQPNKTQGINLFNKPEKNQDKDRTRNRDQEKQKKQRQGEKEKGKERESEIRPIKSQPKCSFQYVHIPIVVRYLQDQWQQTPLIN